MNDQEILPFFRQAYAGAWITQGLAVAAELGLADLLADGSLSVEELAKRTGANGGGLYRLMRALAGVGVFERDADGRFALTPRAGMLRSGVHGSQRDFASMMGAEFQATWGELLHTVRTGEAGFQKRFGAPFFEYMTRHPDRHRIYDDAMTGVHGGETGPMLAAYDFSRFRTVVDVGGGKGLLLAAVLDRHPAVQGILFDLPAVADRARDVLSGSAVAGRCRVEGGDFFAAVPDGADAYVLRHVIHDWEDRDAVAILRRCREAMHSDGRILVVEMVIPDGNRPHFGKWLDLMMLLVGGRERTEEEYARLFTEAGLRLTRIVPTEAEISVVEGARA